jgi:hypothetical protein
MKRYSQQRIWKLTINWLESHTGPIPGMARWPDTIDVRPVELAVKQLLVDDRDPELADRVEQLVESGLGLVKQLMLGAIQGRDLTEVESAVVRACSQPVIDHTDVIGVTLSVAAATWFWRDRNFCEITSLPRFIGSRCIGLPKGEVYDLDMTVVYTEDNPEYKHKVAAAVGSDIVWFWSEVPYSYGDRISATVVTQKCWERASLVKIKKFLN